MQSEDRCEICDKPLGYKYEPRYCCGGYDCGCRGQPTEPCWCGDCWDRIVNKGEKHLLPGFAQAEARKRNGEG
jgi:hypothetical protein